MGPTAKTPGRKEVAKRSYSSSLREQQAADTRQRVVDAALELISSQHSSTVSMPEVAAHAGVSVMTVYRYFPTKSDLFRALGEYGRQVAMPVELPASVDELVESLPSSFERSLQMQGLTRASFAGGETAEARTMSRPNRLAQVDGALASTYPHLDADDRRRLQALTLLLTSPIACLHMGDTVGLSAEDAADAAGWAIETIVNRAVRSGAAHRVAKPGRARKGKNHDHD